MKLRYALYLFWSVWIVFCVAFAAYALTVYTFDPFPRTYLLHVPFIMAAFWPFELFALAWVPQHVNVFYKGLRRYVDPALRPFLVDFAALVGFGEFCFAGMVATVTSRNAFYCVADIVLGSMALAVYAARRRSALDFVCSDYPETNRPV